MDKIALLISQGMELLGRKFDTLADEIKNQEKPEAPSYPQPVINVPEPQITVNVPPFEIPTPIVNVEKPDAPIVNVPPVVFPDFPAPIVNVPEIQIPPAHVVFPERMKVDGMEELIKQAKKALGREEEPIDVFGEVSSKRPLSVAIIGKDGKRITEFGGEFSAPSMVSLKVGNTAVGEDNLLPVTTDGFSIPVFDTQVIDESAAPATTTITYKRSGTTVAVKTISVVGSITTISVTIT